ncbi:hypothetical protein ACFS2C_09260 [Prauserella oleivorans]|uniref:PE domain-containing protein n=1 Tax=Prauserella oleivorans TaxID=1478153 RepID=A0ABW5W8M6_9PSEU
MATTGNWLSDVTFWVDGKASGGKAAPAGGGSAAPAGGQGFSLSREEAEVALREFRAIQDELMYVSEKARFLLQMKPPADDPASVRMNEAATGGAAGQGAFGHGAEHVVAEYEYFRDLVTRLETALGYYQEEDESAGRQVGQSGGSTDPDKGFLE